jgi:hypothetical protein
MPTLKNCIKAFAICVICVICVRQDAKAQTLADYDYENLTFRGIGVDYGMIWPSKVDRTNAYSLRLDLGFLGPGVRVSPSVTYWSSDFKTSELNRLAAQINALPKLQNSSAPVTANDLGQIKWSDLSIGVDAHILWTTPLGIYTYVGAGGAVHVMNGQGQFIQNTFVEDLLDSVSAGVALMAGLEGQVAPRLRLYGEARYTVASDIRYPGFRVGAALMLPPRARTTP